ncbi:MAG: hypothetical protein M3Q37_04795 [Gemmatimonadota bacterium]|nr:hypothetical protein [Gemmatimonadota bacterium]
MQPSELVAIMAAIIYSGRRDPTAGHETRQAAVEEAWKIWHLTMEERVDPSPRPFGPTLEP